MCGIRAVLTGASWAPDVLLSTLLAHGFRGAADDRNSEVEAAEDNAPPTTSPSPDSGLLCAADWMGRRGPDATGTCQALLGSSVRVSLSASLLQLRGRADGVVPSTSEDGSALAFNGEIFGGLDMPDGTCDAEVLFAALRAAAAASGGAGVVAVLSALQGPWSAAFLDAASRTLWIARDALGRRSLLAAGRPGEVEFASVASTHPEADATQRHVPVVEVPPGIWSLRVEPGSSGDGEEARGDTHDAAGLGDGARIHAGAVVGVCEGGAQRVVLRRWDFRDGLSSDVLAWRRRPLTADGSSGEARLAVVGRMLTALQEAVRVMCTALQPTRLYPRPPDVPPTGPPAELLSPPAPVMVLLSGGVDSTLLAALAHRCLPPSAPIDLCSVCFDHGRSPDRIAAVDALDELRSACPGRVFRLIAVDADMPDVHRLRDRLLALMHPSGAVMDLNLGTVLWLATMARGRLLVGTAPKHESETHTCTSPATDDSPSQQGMTAPPATDGHAQRQATAPRRRRRVRPEPPGPSYPADPSSPLVTSAARVVLLGHGADELFAGYSRHRTRFATGGAEGLEEELAMDMRRLWVRNLGRDDRVVSDAAREARHPFLHESVLRAVLDTPCSLLADLTEPPGTGDKRVLRDCLRVLGLPRAAGRVKRAMQFGSRIGRLSNRSSFGSNRRANRLHVATLDARAMALGGADD